MKTKSLSIFLFTLFVAGMNLGAEEDKNENKGGDNFEYEKIDKEVSVSDIALSLKTILIGNSMVGKSALITKICKNEFSDVYSATVGFELFNLKFRIVIGMKELVLKYDIWDICGNEIYRSLITSFYNNASVVLLAYDVTNVKSFNDIDGWVKEAKEKNPKVIEHFVLIGTKIDLNDKRVVSKENGEKFAKANGMKFVEVSAQTGAGITDLENILAKIIYEESKKKEEKKEKNENDKKNNKRIIEEDDNGYVSIEEGKPTHSSSWCDCCKEICANC